VRYVARTRQNPHWPGGSWACKPLKSPLFSKDPAQNKTSDSKSVFVGSLTADRTWQLLQQLDIVANHD
jgi:hypothetical protein